MTAQEVQASTARHLLGAEVCRTCWWSTYRQHGNGAPAKTVLCCRTSVYSGGWRDASYHCHHYKQEVRDGAPTT